MLATASSDAVLPQVMRKLERMGVKDSVVGLVVPTGYSFNLDAFSIYLTLAVVFIAQATNTPLSLGDLLLVLGVSLVTSKGAHGVPGSAIVILAATLNAVPAFPRSASCWCCRSTGSSAWRARSAISSAIASPPSSSAPGRRRRSRDGQARARRRVAVDVTAG